MFRITCTVVSGVCWRRGKRGASRVAPLNAICSAGSMETPRPLSPDVGPSHRNCHFIYTSSSPVRSSDNRLISNLTHIAPIAHLKMDALGLPMSFGKRQVNQPEPVAGSSEPAAARGDASGRGSRGVVGGGKRNRGRGRGGSVHATGSNSSPIPTEAFNVGVKVSCKIETSTDSLSELIHPLQLKPHRFLSAHLHSNSKLQL